MSPGAALGGLAGLGAASLLALGAIAEARRPPPDPALAPGVMRRLPSGATHLVWQGPSAGPRVVLIHGLSSPSEVWAPLADRLAAAGIRTLRYDLFGRGYSARPARVHDARLYMRQLSDLLDAEGVSDPVTLAGYSMGGAIAARFADAHPGRVRGLALLAPAGLIHGLSGLYAVAARLPGLGDALWSLRAGPMLVAGARSEAAACPALAAAIARDAGSRGYAPALLSSLRHLLSRPCDATHGRLARRGVPVFAVWGGRDTVIPPRARARLAAANPDAASLLLEDAGHGLAHTHADAVSAALVPWVRALA